MTAQPFKFSYSKMSEMKRQHAKRCLFGKSDPVKLSEDLKIISEAEAKRCREKWSFDPVTGPVENGSYKFIPVDPLCEIPSFYTKGYTLKSKPVRLMRNCTPYVAVLSRPSLAKRKLDLEDRDENIDGNSENIDKINCLLRGVDFRFQNLSSSVSNVSELGDSCLSSVGLTRSSSAPTLPELSPISHNKDIMTPPSKLRSQVQSSIKDYLANKKQRVNAKPMPKT